MVSLPDRTASRGVVSAVLSPIRAVDLLGGLVVWPDRVGPTDGKMNEAFTRWSKRARMAMLGDLFATAKTLIAFLSPNLQLKRFSRDHRGR